jgi:non-specific serine/threonine protein kinase/serine/threonine-protein kinase
LQRALRGDLDSIVLKALRKEPQRRYLSVEQMAEDIRRHLQALPVRAAPDSISYRARKFVRRHRAAVTAIGLIVFAVIAGALATLREARIAAANARRAEQRFTDVRKLANSLMFEIHDSIEELPGSISARRLIVQRSLEYLDRLSQESAGDVSLQRELADAYERIGLVHGDPRGSNLGDINGARDSFFKAFTIRQKIMRSVANPTAADRLALASSYREMCAISSTYLGQIGAALDYCGQAVAGAEALYKEQPNDPKIRTELAKDYESTGLVCGEGGTSGNAADWYTALDNHRKALDLVAKLARERQDDLDLKAWQASLTNLAADDLFGIGHVSQAIPLYRQAAVTFEELIKKSNKARLRDSLTFTYQRMGDMLLVAGRFEQSIVFYRKQLAIAEDMVATDPKSVSYRTGLVASRATYGHALWRAGHVQQSLETFDRALAELAETHQQDSLAVGLDATLRLWMAGALEKKRDINGALRNYLSARDYYSGVCAADPKNVEDCLSFAGVLDRIGRIHVQRGQLDDALAEYQQALAIAEPPSVAPKPNVEAVYTVVNVYFGLGEVQVALAGKAASNSARTEQRKQACSWYQKSRSAFQRIPEWLPITPDEYDSRPAKDIEDRLSRCESAADTHRSQ